MSLALLFHYLMLNMFRMLIHPSILRSLHPDTTPPQPNHNVTTTRIEPEQYNPWNNSTNKSQAPEDGCINIQNMLSIKLWNNKTSDIKLVSLFIQLAFKCVQINQFLLSLLR